MDHTEAVRIKPSLAYLSAVAIVVTTSASNIRHPSIFVSLQISNGIEIAEALAFKRPPQHSHSYFLAICDFFFSERTKCVFCVNY